MDFRYSGEVASLQEPLDDTNFDSRMTIGCGVFVVVSLLTFFIAIAPFFVWTEHWKLAELIKCMGVGLGLASIIHFFAVRVFEVPAAIASLATSVVFAIFLYLRIDQITLLSGANKVPASVDYPLIYKSILPMACILVTLTVVGLAMSLGSAKKEQ